MDVSDVLRDRMHEPPGLQRMAVVSALVHAAMVAVVVIGPRFLLPRQQSLPRSIMTISLSSGAPGPNTGGLTAPGQRAVQAETTPDVKRPAPTPPAAKAPEMTVPLPGKAPAKQPPAPTVKQAPDAARGRTPSRGAETAPGTAVTDTSVRGQGFGLSTSGGVGKGVQLDVTDFCCLSYIELMNERIRQHWDPRAETLSQVVVAFTVQRNGTLTEVVTERSSGYTLLDNRARSAVMTTREVPPLPAEFPNPTLRVHVTFEYIR